MKKHVNGLTAVEHLERPRRVLSAHSVTARKLNAVKPARMLSLIVAFVKWLEEERCCGALYPDDGLLNDVEGPQHLTLGHDERRCQGEHVSHRGLEREPAVERAVQHRLG